MKEAADYLSRYRRVAMATVAATLFLILVGGLVRAAGAGLGCPDWPKCFGSWIPPTSVEQLPPEFDAGQFNVYKTWIEYVNRLVGVAIGLLISATMLLSIRIRKARPEIFYASLAAWVLVIFQGWLGGQVVESELKEWLITVHMLLAMVIVNLLLYAAFASSSAKYNFSLPPSARQSLWIAALVVFVLALGQMVLGTQVREGIDAITNSTPDLRREFWIPSLGQSFELHRSFSWLIVIGTLAVLWLSRGREIAESYRKVGYGLAAVVAAQILSGVGLQYLDLPPVLQVLHLVLSSFLVCLLFLLLLMLRQSAKSDRRAPIQGVGLSIDS